MSCSEGSSQDAEQKKWALHHELAERLEGTFRDEQSPELGRWSEGILLRTEDATLELARPTFSSRHARQQKSFNC